jgi:hypothetical protein
VVEEGLPEIRDVSPVRTPAGGQFGRSRTRGLEDMADSFQH